ncbi:hypothetical protein ACFQZC_01420 [Streptacidiphilus monticola]
MLYLDGFSAAAWDFRAKAARAAKAGYVERNQVDVEEVAGAREALAVAAAQALGLVTARPPRSSRYDHVLILGGLVRANLWRAAYAGALLSGGHIDAPSVTALTAFRRLARNEQDMSLDEPSLLDAFALPRRQTEADVMEDCLARAFELESDFVTEAQGGEYDDHDRFRVAAAKAQGRTVTLVAAPNPAGANRANTGQTMRFWAEQVARLRPGDSILFVTSSIYVPFQHVVALQNLALPYQAQVDTVGVDHALVDPAPMPQEFRGVHYLQELRSAIRSFRHLLGDLDATPPS